MMPKPNRKSDVRQAAAQLFRQQGFSATSMDDVSAAVGLNKSSLYHYYSSKSDLLIDVVLAPEKALVERLEMIALDEDPASQLRSIITVVADVSDEWPDEVAVGFAERPWMQHLLDDEQLAELAELRLRMSDRVSLVVRAGQDSGVFKPSIDRLVVIHMLAALAGSHTHSQMHTTDSVAVGDRRKFVESYATLLLNGLIQPRDIAD